MKLSPAGLRKAAILVANLDMAASDALLDQLTPEQAQQVRHLAVDMEEIDQQERQRVIDEFLRVGPKTAAKTPPGIELEGSLAQFAVGGRFQRAKSPEPAKEESRPFGFLQETEAEKLVRILSDERPQTIALVLSHLPPTRAASVLSRLQSATQAEVLRRLVDLEEADPEILREVESALESRLAQQITMQRRRVAGLQAVAGILDAVDGRTGMQILENLAVHDRGLAERLGPHPITFDDLGRLDDDVLLEVFETAGRELMVPALLGADPAMAQRILSHLPTAQAAAIRRQMEFPGPLRLRDIEEAQAEVARLAQPVVQRSWSGTRDAAVALKQSHWQ